MGGPPSSEASEWPWGWATRTVHPSLPQVHHTRLERPLWPFSPWTSQLGTGSPGSGIKPAAATENSETGGKPEPLGKEDYGHGRDDPSSRAAGVWIERVLPASVFREPQRTTASPLPGRSRTSALENIRDIYIYFCGIWKFLGQGFNPSCSCNLCHSCGNTRSFNPLHPWVIKPVPPQQPELLQLDS